VVLKVTDTEPPLKGATASGSGKPATLETGLVVTVPQFIQIGEMVSVSTTSREYLERAKK
jgi:elongation factor P